MTLPLTVKLVYISTAYALDDTNPGEYQTNPKNEYWNQAGQETGYQGSNG